MKLSNFMQDSSTRPFRFAVVLAALFITALIVGSAESQEFQTANNHGKLHWTTSYQEALDDANKRNTPVMLVFGGSDWCPWCQKLSSEVFETAEFIAWSDSRVIPVMLDFPKTKQLPESLAKQNNLLLDRFRPNLSGFPTVLFVKPDGTVIGKIGYEPGGSMMWIHKAQQLIGKHDKVTFAAPDRKLNAKKA